MDENMINNLCWSNLWLKTWTLKEIDSHMSISTIYPFIYSKIFMEHLLCAKYYVKKTDQSLDFRGSWWEQVLKTEHAFSYDRLRFEGTRSQECLLRWRNIFWDPESKLEDSGKKQSKEQGTGEEEACVWPKIKGKHQGQEKRNRKWN